MRINRTWGLWGMAFVLGACGQLETDAQNQEKIEAAGEAKEIQLAEGSDDAAGAKNEDADEEVDESAEQTDIVRSYASVPALTPLKVLSTFAYAINPKAKVSGTPEVMFVDLFDTSAAKIKSYKDKGQRVICYFSAGTRESWRSDKSKFPSKAVGKKMEEWDGENWVDYRDSGVRSVISARIANAKKKGCEGIDPDNVDGHLNSSGFSLKSADQKSFISFLADEAHANGMLVGLKNSAETASKLNALVDFAVVEECHAYSECSSYSSFSKKNKAVFQVEYSAKSSSLCSKAKSQMASLIFSDYDLKSFKTCQ